MEADSLCIVTNNSLVRDAFPEMLVHYVEGDAEAVHAALEALLQDHHTLLTTAIPPNVPMIRSPVRSVFVEKSEKKYDKEGLLHIEKSRQRLAVLGAGPGHRPMDRKDLEMIDLDHLRRTRTQL